MKYSYKKGDSKTLKGRFEHTQNYYNQFSLQEF